MSPGIMSHTLSPAALPPMGNDRTVSMEMPTEVFSSHLPWSLVASNSYTLQIPLTILADWLQSPGLPTANISGMNQDGQRIDISLSHCENLMTLSVFGGAQSPFESTEAGWVCHMTTVTMSSEATVAVPVKASNPGIASQHPLGPGNVIPIQLSSETSNSEVSQGYPTPTSSGVATSLNEGHSSFTSGITDSNVECLHKLDGYAPQSFRGERVPVSGVEMRSESLTISDLQCRSELPGGSTCEMNNVMENSVSATITNGDITDIPNPIYTGACNDKGIELLSSHETPDATVISMNTEVQSQDVADNRTQISDVSSECESSNQISKSAKTGEQEVTDDCTESNVNHQWPKRHQRYEVKYEVRGSGKCRVRIKRFQRTGVTAQKCVVCGKLLGSISTLHRHVKNSHQVHYKDYRKVVLALNFQANVGASLSSRAKAEKLRTLSRTRALELLERWKKRGKIQRKSWLLLECPACGRKFGNSRNFQLHVASKHPSVNLSNLQRPLAHPAPNTIDYKQLTALNEALVLKVIKETQKIEASDTNRSDAVCENKEGFVQYLAKHTCLVCLAQLKHRYSLLRHLQKHHFVTASDYISLLQIDNKAKRLQEIRRIKAAAFRKKKSKKEQQLTGVKGKRTLFHCPGCSEVLSHGFSLIIHVKKRHSEDLRFAQLLLEADEQVSRVVRRDVGDQESFMIKCHFCGCQRVGRNIIKHLKNCHEWEETYDEVYRAADAEYTALARGREATRKKRSEQRSHDTGMLYGCAHCPASFKHRASKHRHENFMCKNNPNLRESFWCKVCGKRVEGHDRQTHKRECTSTNQYICHQCGKCCLSKSALSSHQRSKHQKADASEAVHACPVCSKRFHKSCLLQTHIASHSDNRESQCELCGKQFKTTQAVRKHQNSVHFNKYPYHCSKCGHGVMRSSYLETHKCGRVRRAQTAANTPTEAAPTTTTTSPKNENNTQTADDLAENFANVLVQETATAFAEVPPTVPTVNPVYQTLHSYTLPPVSTTLLGNANPSFSLPGLPDINVVNAGAVSAETAEAVASLYNQHQGLPSLVGQVPDVKLPYPAVSQVQPVGVPEIIHIIMPDK